MDGTGDSESQKEEKAGAEAGWLEVNFQEGLPQRTVVGLRMKRCWAVWRAAWRNRNQSESYGLVGFEAQVTIAIIITPCTDSDGCS